MRKSKSLLLFISTLLVCNVSLFAADINIIPQPNNINTSSGNLVLSGLLVLDLKSNDPAILEIVKNFKPEIKRFTGITINDSKGSKTGVPVLSISINSNSGALGDEGYVLKIKNDSIIILANASQGLFYATRSLLQMVSAGHSTKGIILNNCIIHDYPRYPWRGMHLDVSRHFFNKEFIFRYLDAMALHKLNVFHWHLADDQGWRVEIKKYPRLTELGAWREDNEDKGWSYFQYPTKDPSKKLYGGFYTQDDIREIVKYAAQRQILIVPEIDVPGHSTAAIYAYPELSCSKVPWTKDPAIPFEFSAPLCAGNDFTYQFLKDVFSELCELFPGPYFHIGGDECNHNPWHTCKACQLKMKENHLSNEKQLQSYFNQQLETFLISKSKRLIGWEEIAEGGISSSSMLMSWKGEEAGIEAARKRMQVIMVPSNYLYFDSSQETQINKEDDYKKSITLKKVYDYNPDPAILGPADCRNILGVQGALWSEFVFNDLIAEKVTFPRLCALSEVGWTMTENKSYENFQKKLIKHYDFLDKANIRYYVLMPSGVGSELVFNDKTTIELTNNFGKGKIYYTTDGSEPSLQSPVYSKPLTFKQTLVLKSKVIISPTIESKSRISKLIRQEPKAAVKVNNLTPGLNLKYSVGMIDSVVRWGKLTYVKSDVVPDFSIPLYAQPDAFGLEFDGFIKIPANGIYTFSTSSDDGSCLFLDDVLLVNNDGCHGPGEIGNQVSLLAGYHKIKVKYFEALYGNLLTVFIAGKNLPHQLIPPSMLFK